MRQKVTSQLRFPALSRGCVLSLVPSMGPTGLTLRDLSGFKSHGTPVGMSSATAWVPSQKYALRFQGAEYVSIPVFPAYSFGTLSFWILNQLNNDNSAYFTYYNTAGGAGTNIFYVEQSGTSGAMRILIRNNGGTVIDATSATGILTLNEWVCVTITMAASGGLKIYRNGVEFALTFSTGTSSTRAWISDITGPNLLTLGRLLDGVMRYPTCMMDDVFVSSRVINPRLLSLRRGITSEVVPRRRLRALTGGFKAYWASRNAQIIGGGL